LVFSVAAEGSGIMGARDGEAPNGGGVHQSGHPVSETGVGLGLIGAVEVASYGILGREAYCEVGKGAELSEHHRKYNEILWILFCTYIIS
jgi:hypothetical protein